MTRAILVALAIGCSGGPPEPPASLATDVRTLQRAITSGRELSALEDVENAIDDDLPVRAAELLEAGAIPAARRHAAELDTLSMASEEATALRDEGKRLVEGRVAALEAYRDVLQRGLVEDIELLAALRGQREAEDAIDAFLGRLDQLNPLPDLE